MDVDKTKTPGFRPPDIKDKLTYGHLLLSGFITFIIMYCLGLVVHLPSLMTDPKPANCTTKFSDYGLQQIACMCGKYCESRYPCLRVFVTFTTEDGWRGEGMLHEGAFSEQCSYYPKCSPGEAALAHSVREFQRRFGTEGTTFRCYYKPGEKTWDVSLSLTSRRTEIIPFLVLLAMFVPFGVVMVLTYCPWDNLSSRKG